MVVGLNNCDCVLCLIVLLGLFVFYGSFVLFACWYVGCVVYGLFLVIALCCLRFIGSCRLLGWCFDVGLGWLLVFCCECGLILFDVFGWCVLLVVFAFVCLQVGILFVFVFVTCWFGGCLGVVFVFASSGLCYCAKLLLVFGDLC